MNSLGRSRCNGNVVSLLKKNGGSSRRRRLVHTTPSTPQFMRQSDVYISSRWSNGTSIIRRQQHQSYHHLQNHTVRGAGGSSKTASTTGASCKTNRDSYYFKAKRMHSSIMLRQTLYQQQHQQQASSSRPTNAQLKHLFFVSAVPMIGFGFMDNIIMIEAGSYIDTTLGVKLGISTLMAAALGQVVSDLSGVLFGGVVERSMMSLGMLKPASHLSPLTVAQRSLPIVKNVTMAGSAVGVVVGCLLGASTLLLHNNKEDTHHHDDVTDTFTMKTVQEMIQLHSLEDIKKVYWIQVEGDTFNTSNETLANAVKEGTSIVQEQYETSSEVLYVPIKHKKTGTVVGVVTFEKSTGHTFDTQEMKMVNLLSKQVAVVMHHGER